jgi:hypothetical protein
MIHHLIRKKMSLPGGHSKPLTTAACNSNAVSCCCVVRPPHGFCTPTVSISLARGSKTTSLSGTRFCNCCSGRYFGVLCDRDDLASDNCVLDMYRGTWAMRRSFRRR